mgnify:CR=1 FL=1
MPNLVNRLIAAEYDAVIKKSEGALICTLGGITVHQLEKLRGELAKEGVRLRMIRNSLLRRALAERGFELPADVLTGNMGIAVGSIEGTIHAARVLTSPEVKKGAKLFIKGAIFDGQLLGAKDAVALAGLPDKRTLRGQLVGCIQGPIRGVVTLLNGVPSGVVRVVAAHNDKQEGAPAAS